MGRVDDIGFGLTESVILARVRLAVERRISALEWGLSWDLDALIEEEANILLLRLRAEGASEEVDRVYFPADWWEAVKEEFAPDWFLRRWPVRYTEIKATAYYPELQLRPYHQYGGTIRLKVQKEVDWRRDLTNDLHRRAEDS